MAVLGKGVKPQGGQAVLPCAELLHRDLTIDKGIEARATVDVVIPRAAANPAITTQAAQRVIAAATVDHVVIRPAVDHIYLPIAHNTL